MNAPHADAGSAARIERYLSMVADHLAINDMPAGRVGEHLTELAEHLADTQGDPWTEFGQPEHYARELIAADRRALRPIGRRAATIGMTVFLGSLGAVLVGAGSDPVAVPTHQLLPLAIMAVVAGVASSSRWSATVRDSLRRDNPDPRRRWRLPVFALGCGLVTGFVSWVLLGLPGAVVRWPHVPSWAAGLVLLLAAVPAFVASIRVPRFPPQSRLRSSRLSQRIHLTPDEH